MYRADQALQPDAEAVVRLLEASAQVRRRHQFFGWVQTHLKGLLPHAVISGGIYQRARRSLAFDLFNSVVLSPPLMTEFGDGRSELLRGATEAWVAAQSAGQTHALVLDAGTLLSNAEHLRAITEAGLRQLLVHGVSRPQRPAEIESFFLLAEPHQTSGERELLCLEMLLPCLHATYLRVRATELDMGIKDTAPKLLAAAPLANMPSRLTERERQILSCVREGKSNPQIGEMLGISALTVKNHVQNILRKLGASNRAQAVAKAGALGPLTSVAHPTSGVR